MHLNCIVIHLNCMVIQLNGIVIHFEDFKFNQVSMYA